MGNKNFKLENMSTSQLNPVVKGGYLLKNRKKNNLSSVNLRSAMDYNKNESLKSEMEYNEKEGARNNIAISAQINKLQEIVMLYAQKIEMENQKNKQLEEEIKIRENLIQDQRNKLREDNNAPKNLTK